MVAQNIFKNQYFEYAMVIVKDLVLNYLQVNHLHAFLLDLYHAPGT